MFQVLCRSILLRLHQISSRIGKIQSKNFNQIFAECWSNGRVWKIGLFFSSSHTSVNKVCVCVVLKPPSFQRIGVMVSTNNKRKSIKMWIKGWNCTNNTIYVIKPILLNWFCNFSAPFSFSSLHKNKNNREISIVSINNFYFFFRFELRNRRKQSFKSWNN